MSRLPPRNKTRCFLRCVSGLPCNSCYAAQLEQLDATRVVSELSKSAPRETRCQSIIRGREGAPQTAARQSCFRSRAVAGVHSRDGGLSLGADRRRLGALRCHPRDQLQRRHDGRAILLPVPVRRLSAALHGAVGTTLGAASQPVHDSTRAGMWHSRAHDDAIAATVPGVLRR